MVVTFTLYRQDLPKAALQVLFYSRLGFGVFRPTGATRYTYQGEIWQVRSSLPNFTLIGSGLGVYGPKTENNLLRWGRFQPNFRRPLAAKLWNGPKNVRSPLSPCKFFCISRDARWRERTKCDVFHFVFCLFVNNARRPSTALVRS